MRPTRLIKSVKRTLVLQQWPFRSRFTALLLAALPQFPDRRIQKYHGNFRRFQSRRVSRLHEGTPAQCDDSGGAAARFSQNPSQCRSLCSPEFAFSRRTKNLRYGTSLILLNPVIQIFKDPVQVPAQGFSDTALAGAHKADQKHGSNRRMK